MIVPMMKYTLLLYYKEYNSFLEQLQELGLVDITLSTWEPDQEQRELISGIEQHHQAALKLRERKKTIQSAVAKVTLQGADEAFATYTEATHRLDQLRVERVRLDKLIEEVLPWGDFDPQQVRQLKEAGITLHFYMTNTKEFAANATAWGESYTVEAIGNDAFNTYFVVAAPEAEVISLGNAQEVKAPEADHHIRTVELQHVDAEIAQQELLLDACVFYIDQFEAKAETLRNQLHLAKVSHSGQAEAEGTLYVLEGWATMNTQAKVDEMLEHTSVVYFKERPTPEDENVPVLLKNNPFAHLFELIGSFYALPKYGTTDMTPYFGPFYMIFFGFCLGDGGYGLLFVLAGLFMALKVKGAMRQIGWLTVWCGAATMLFGALSGSFFGIQLADVSAFAAVRERFLTQNDLFTLAIAVGFVHLLFGMTIRVIGTTRQFGFKYALSTIGWMLVIVASLTAGLLPMAGIEFYTMSSVAYMATVGVGLFMMLFLNSPGKNPLANFGAGLWNTYNDVTGLLGDVLSYIRLFALGLSGGILALVFNDLAMGLSPDIPVVRQVVIILILLVGHGINIFMSSLGSFVHPMRLTFVEFYKNAGFEAGQRAFQPLRKNKK